VLYGEKLKGGFALVKLKNGREENAWLLIKEKDDYVSKTDVTKKSASVLSGRKLPRDGGTPLTKEWHSNKTKTVQKAAKKKSAKNK
jgi:bifunctional non-homologous end joining protein LigD